ncbi:Protein kinase C-like 1 [Cladochytrium tenue]|nr:Protein kinase C-like 1 [Cladochytrium tenue]
MASVAKPCWAGASGLRALSSSAPPRSPPPPPTSSGSRLVFRNPSVATCYEHALRFEAGTRVSSSGALVARSGAKTGRSPTDKRVVREAAHEARVWWGPVNQPVEPAVFEASRARAVDFLQGRERLCEQ